MKRQENDAEVTRVDVEAPERPERWAGEVFVCGTNTTRCFRRGRTLLLVCVSWPVSLSRCSSALTEPIAVGVVCPCGHGRDRENGSISEAEED